MKTFIVDTDIGTDLDDTLALLYAYNHPDAHVAVVSTVHGNTDIRGRIAQTLFNELGDSPIILPGAKNPLKSKTIHWTGYEAKGMNLALTQIVACTPAYFYPEFVEHGATIVGLGPLTNIAHFVDKFPELAKQTTLYFMGSVREENGRYVPDSKGHNVQMDELAAQKVFDSKMRITVIPKEIVKTIAYSLNDILTIPQAQKVIRPHAKACIDDMGFFDFYMYDPLTMALAIQPDLGEYETKQNIRVVRELKKPIREIMREYVFGDMR